MRPLKLGQIAGRNQRIKAGVCIDRPECWIQKKMYQRFWFNRSCTKKIFFPSSSFFQRLHLKNRPHYIFSVYRFRSGGRLLGVSDVCGSSIIFCFDAGGLWFLCSGGAWFAWRLRLLDYRVRLRRDLKVFGHNNIAATAKRIQKVINKSGEWLPICIKS